MLGRFLVVYLLAPSEARAFLRKKLLNGNGPRACNQVQPNAIILKQISLKVAPRLHISFRPSSFAGASTATDTMDTLPFDPEAAMQCIPSEPFPLSTETPQRFADRVLRDDTLILGGSTKARLTQTVILFSCLRHSAGRLAVAWVDEEDDSGCGWLALGGWLARWLAVASPPASDCD